jgi:TonB family protein
MTAIIRLSFLALILFTAQTKSYFGQSYNDENISLACNEESLRSVLETIRTSSGINFIYQDNLVDNKNVTCKINNRPINDAVKTVLSGLNISFKSYGEKAFVLFKEKKPQKITYKAIVVDQNTDSIKVVASKIPELISGITPVYPYEASKNNIEGKVKLRFLINTNGDVDKVTIESTSGSEILDSAAIDYINRLKFMPAEENGIRRRVWMSMVLKYLVVDY